MPMHLGRLSPCAALVALAMASCSPPPSPPEAAPRADAKVAANGAPSAPGAPPEALAASRDPPLAPPPAQVAAGSRPCVTPPPPRLRTGGNLVVESPPRAPSRSHQLRLRTHVEGALTLNSQRVWIGPEVPPFVLLVGGTRELFLLEEAPDGFVGLYRDPYDAASCKLGGTNNCSFGVALFDCAGQQRWLFLLDPLLSRPDHLEVQDMRYADGVLYFNEACQSYAREAGGRCSSLVAVEPLTRSVLWRTPPLVSNNVFLVHQRYLITGYGFTAEPDALFIVRRADGKVMQRVPIPSAHAGLSLDPSGTLTAVLSTDQNLLFKTEGFDGDRPRLTPLPGAAGRPLR
jgi:hypothetical protein